MSIDIEIFDCDTGDVMWNVYKHYSEVSNIGGWDNWSFSGGEACTRGKAVWKGVGGVMLITTNVYNNAGLVFQTINNDGSSTVYN